MDFYVILGLQHGATPDEIKRAYRRLARKYHPDVNPGDRVAEARFRQLVEAYETLTDAERRRRYDSGDDVAREKSDSSFEFEGFDFSVVAEGARASTFGELFADTFSRRTTATAAAKPEQGADLHSTASLTFDEAMRGVQREVTITRLEACMSCGGAGTMHSAEGRCTQCHGTGSLKSARGHMVFSKTCTRCAGTGRLGRRPCSACAGEGVGPRGETVTVRIPAGVGEGTRVRVPGKGNAGRRGGVPGDLQITTHVEPHPIFRRDADDLSLVVPVAIHEAALGAKIDVPTIDGSTKLRVPPGTQSGQRFRLRGHGAPSPRDGQRGDLVVEIKLVLPRLADERSKELLREFGRIHAENVRKDLGV